MSEKLQTSDEPEETRGAAALAHDEVLRLSAKEPVEIGKLSEKYLDALEALYQAQRPQRDGLEGK